jgi:3,5-epimerase/4-reductase
MLDEMGEDVVTAPSSVRIENRHQLEILMDIVRPTRILCAAGITGRPNVCYLEDHKDEAIRVNVVGMLSAADVAHKLNIHFTAIQSGCIYEYDAEHPIGGKGFTEEDTPNFTKSFYSKTKAMCEELLCEYPQVLVARLRMPIGDQLNNPRCFLKKISTYQRICSIPNSVSVLSDILPLIISMAKRGLTGKYNCTNLGVVSHNECLEMYRDIVDSSFTWQNFTLEEQGKILKAPRSNNCLDVSKLIRDNPDAKLPTARDAVRQVLERMVKNQKSKLVVDLTL